MLLLAQSSIRMGPSGGFLGFDMGTIVQIAQSLEYDVKAVVKLIGDAQGVIVEQMNK